MSESITLPRSGIAATFLEVGWSDDTDYEVRLHGFLLGYGGSPEKAIADADKEALALRSALLPRDAVERVAKWFVDEDGDRYGARWDETPECRRDDARCKARAVLAALGVTNG